MLKYIDLLFSTLLKEKNVYLYVSEDINLKVHHMKAMYVLYFIIKVDES